MRFPRTSSICVIQPFRLSASFGSTSTTEGARTMWKIGACLAACAIAIPAPAKAWDYPGHRIVGAIADLVLQQHYPATYKRVSDLLEIRRPGDLWQKRSLREVAVFPDC